MTEQEQKKAAKEFASLWKGKGYEKGQSQQYWISLLSNVFGIKNPEEYIIFEEQVKLDHTAFIDGYISASHVMIEQKSIDKDLRKPIRQSDGTMLTPFQQAKRYASELPYSQRPRWIVTCNFAEFLVYDMEHPQNEPQSILLKDLEKDYRRLNFLADVSDDNIRKETEISLKAGVLVGKLYDALLSQYSDKKSEHSLKSLNILCVRLVFCLYAEDAGVFGRHNLFHDYIKSFDASHVRTALIELFKILDTELDKRDPYLEKPASLFPYVNGGLFADEYIEIPRFTRDIVNLLLVDCSENFDWSCISPTIFGAVFESTLNPVTRRNSGMHYTSIENIHKVIDPLFFNDLRVEFENIKDIQNEKKRNVRLDAFQDKIAALTFLDPACGSGNFLTETYISLRRLENDILRTKKADNQILIGLDIANPIKVSISQFYGIEINDFAVTVAKTALWIAESQMMQETEDIIQASLDFLPLKSYGHIVEGNALKLDWKYLIDNDLPNQTIVYAENTTLNILEEPIVHYGDIDLYTKTISSTKINVKPLKPIHYDFIMGNPPFVGARYKSDAQKKDILNIFGTRWNNVGNLDYVSCWYKKAADFIKGTTIHCAFVSTNSICQGEQVACLWQPLFNAGIHFDFAYRTFRWDSESENKAHVHCVIVGFSADIVSSESCEKTIFDGENIIKAKNINGYLLDADNIFIENRSKPLCDVPEMIFGSMPNDGGFLLFSEDEKNDFIKSEPLSEKYFKSFVGAREYINDIHRYCLWFIDVSPAELRKMTKVFERIKKIRDLRAASKRLSTQKLADSPALFGEIHQPDSNYLLIPKTTSERRKYVPIGFLTPDIIAGDTTRIVPNAEIYHFGILTSTVHMAWMRVVCGRLKSDYSYSNTIVYNNFPWCNPTKEQKEKIEQTAQKILDTRSKYIGSSLADLYDGVTMPVELRKAHQANDRAVMQAYGFPLDFSETDCVAELLKMYKSLT